MRIRGEIRTALGDDLQSGVARNGGTVSLIIKCRLNLANDNPNIIFSACSWPRLCVPNTSRSQQNPNHSSYLLDFKSFPYKFIRHQCKRMLFYPPNNPQIICLLLQKTKELIHPSLELGYHRFNWRSQLMVFGVCGMSGKNLLTGGRKMEE